LRLSYVYKETQYFVVGVSSKRKIYFIVFIRSDVSRGVNRPCRAGHGPGKAGQQAGRARPAW